MRHVILESDINIAVNGCSGFATSTQKGPFMAMLISPSRGTWPIELNRIPGGGHGAGQGGPGPDQQEGHPPQRAGQHTSVILNSDQMLPVLITFLLCDQIGMGCYLC